MACWSAKEFQVFRRDAKSDDVVDSYDALADAEFDAGLLNRTAPAGVRYYVVRRSSGAVLVP